MPEHVRLQLKASDTSDDWKEAGGNSDSPSLPVKITEIAGGVSLTSSFLLEKRDLSAGSMVYKGQNTDASAAESDTDWIITKYTYDGNGDLTVKKTLTGSWTGRASLSW